MTMVSYGVFIKVYFLRAIKEFDGFVLRLIVAALLNL